MPNNREEYDLYILNRKVTLKGDSPEFLLDEMSRLVDVLIDEYLAIMGTDEDELAQAIEDEDFEITKEEEE